MGCTGCSMRGAGISVAAPSKLNVVGVRGDGRAGAGVDAGSWSMVDSEAGLARR